MNSKLIAGGYAWRSGKLGRLVRIVAGVSGILAGGLPSQGALTGLVDGGGGTRAVQGMVGVGHEGQGGMGGSGTMSDRGDAVVGSGFGQLVQRGSRVGLHAAFDPVEVGIRGYEGQRGGGFGGGVLAQMGDASGNPARGGRDGAAFGGSGVSCVREPVRVTWPVAVFGVLVCLHRRKMP